MFFCITAIVWSLFSVSAYTNGTGAPPYQGLTASGRYTDADTLACGPSFPFGTRFHLPDGSVRVCWDRGGAVSDSHLDLWVGDYKTAIALGRRELLVGVVQEGCR